MAEVPAATHAWCRICASSRWSTAFEEHESKRLRLVRGKEQQAKKSSCAVLRLWHGETVGPSKGAAAKGQTVWPQCPALSCQRIQKLQGAGSPAASVWLSLLCLFQVMRPTEEILQELCNPDLFQMFLKIKSLPLLWLVLRGLVLLSERPEMVSRT